MTPAQPPSDTATTRRLPRPRVANAHFVTERLLIGGDLDAWDGELAVRQLVELVDLGLTHVVDARSEWSDEELVGHLAPHVDYLHAGIDDAGQRVPEEWFETVAQWGAAALADPDAVVLAHCHAGINRGPSAGLAILLAVGWDVADALAAIRAARPFAWTDYAEDALRWHHARTGAPEQQRRADEEALVRWRAEDPSGLGRVVRLTRTEPVPETTDVRGG